MKISLLPVKDVLGATTSVSLSFQLDPMSMGKRDFYFPTPILIKGELMNQGELYFFQGEINLALGMNCSRCLQEMTEELSIPFLEEFQRDGHEIVEDAIDISARVLENILLEIPQKPLCNEECKGLCAQCGQDRNKDRCSCQREVIDPRLLVLKDFFNQD